MYTRYFALVAGIAFIVIGFLGFVPGLTMMPDAGSPPLAVNAAHGRLFGLFPVNALHNLVHIALGVWGLVAYAQGTARTFARGTAIIYGLLTVMGLIPALNTTFGFVPIYGHDVWLHGLIAVVAAYFGWAPEPVGATRTARVRA